MPNGEGRRETCRAQSETVGVVLLLGLVITGASLVVVFGSTAIEESQDTATVGGASQTMSQFDSQASLVAHGAADNRTVELPVDRSGSGSTQVVPDAGRLTIEITGDTTLKRTITLGAVRYDQGRTTVAYQGGGVWRHRDDGTVMVSPPEFHYRVTGGGSPTLTLPLVTVSGDGGGSSARLRQAGDTESIIPGPGLSNPIRDSEVNVTVSSRYYRAWGRFFETRTTGDVTYDHAANNVTIELIAPAKGVTVNSPVVSDSGTIQVANGGTLDSYDSRDGPYSSPGGHNADVAVNGTFEPTNSAKIKGEVDATGNAKIDNAITVTRQVRIDGDTTMSNQPKFRREYHTGGDADIDTTNGVIFEDDLVVGGDLTVFKSADLKGTLYVNGNATLGQNSHVCGNTCGDSAGDVIVDGNVTVKKNADIDGTIEAGGDIILEDKAETNDLVAGDDVILIGQSDVTGTVDAGDDVEIRDKGTIDGDVTATDDVFQNATNAQITGDVTAGGAVEGDGVPPDPDGGSDQGSVGGTSTQAASPAPSPSPATAPAPDPASVSIPDSAADEIDETESELSSSNDNGDVSAISGNSLVDPCDPCVLPAGKYFIDTSMTLDGSENLTFRPNGGTVELYVAGDIQIKEDVVVQGGGQVKLYADGNWQMANDGRIVNPDDKANQFWVYMRPGTDAEFTNQAEFRGVLYGPQNATQQVDITVDNNIELFGAMVGGVSQTSNNFEVHYDEALGSSQVFGGGTKRPKVTYLHVSVTEIEVD